MSDAMAIAASGMRAAEARFSNAATHIVTDMRGGSRAMTSAPSQPLTPAAAGQQTGHNPHNAGSGDTETAVQMARMIEAKFGFRANIAVFHAADRMAKMVINIVV